MIIIPAGMTKLALSAVHGVCVREGGLGSGLVSGLPEADCVRVLRGIRAGLPVMLRFKGKGTKTKLSVKGMRKM